MSDNLHRSSVGPWLAILLCLALATAGWAQTTTAGGITGSVTDQTGAVVPNATITIRNLDTNNQLKTNTEADGRFRIISVQPGTYELEARAGNFAPYKAGGIVVQIGVVSTLEIRLSVGAKTETVEVTGEATVVNTVQPDFASNIDQTQINNLPINGRRWSNFAMLAPGAALDGTYGLISFRGMTGLMNNSTIDGGDNNQAFFAEERGRTRASYVVSQASVREFQVNTSNYSAEYGRAAGAVINTVTKSGGNAFHGLVFYNIRDNSLGAYNPLTLRVVTDASGAYTAVPYKPEDRRQQFGGNIGGPIMKDKLFFFFNYDGQRWNMPGVASPRSAGNFKALLDPGSASELKTLAQRMYGLSSSTTPSAAQTAAATTAFDAGRAFFQSVIGIQPRNNPQDIFFPRLDWRVSQNNTFFASYNRMRRTALAMVQSPAVVNRGVGDWGDDLVKVDVVNARLSSAVGNAFSNELRFSWGRDFESQRSSKQQNPTEMAVAALATTPSYGGYLPQTYIASNMYIGRPYYTERYAYPDEHRFQVANTAAYAVGKHMVKFGADISRVNDFMSHVNAGGGQYSYSYRVDFITDFTRITSPSTWFGAASPKWYSSLNQGAGPTDWNFNTWDYAVFVQDDWRILPRLTVNLGLRYEYEQLPKPKIPNPAVPLTMQLPSDGNNIGPRAGFAYDVFGNGKTVLRGGAGMYYARIANSYITSALAGTGLKDLSGNQLGQVNYYVTYSTTGSPTWPNVLAGNVNVSPDIAMFGPHAQNPQIYQADLILEREVMRNTVVSVSYLLGLGRELLNLADANLAKNYTPITYSFYGGPLDGQSTTAQVFTKIATSSGRPNPSFGRMETFLTNVNSNYNALVAQVNRRMTNGLQFQFSYTWSHSLDSGQESFTFTDNSAIKSYDIYQPQYDYGNSNYDVRHRFIANVVWQPQYFKDKGRAAKALLTDWTISPIFAFTSGRPYSEYMSGSPTMPAGTAYVNSSSFNGSGGPSRIATLIGRNHWRMPWLQDIDLRLARTIRIRERHSVELLAEAFNLFNHVNTFYTNNTLYRMCSSSTTPACPTTVPVNTYIYDNTFGTSSGADSTLYRERQVQFGIRYSF